MTIKYHSGERIQATSTDFNSGDGISAVIGGWKELGRTTLGSANSDIDVTSLADKRYLMVLTDMLGVSTGSNRYNRVGNGSIDTGSNYAWRKSEDGGADSTGVSTTVGVIQEGGLAGQMFAVTNYTNLSNKEKLAISHSNVATTTGAGTAPQRTESVFKWTNTSNVIDQIRATTASANTINSGSEVVVLGWDESDTHTDNFWEELASVDLSGGASDTLDTGTFTAKKYLWVQFFNDINGAEVSRASFRFNSDPNANYASGHTNNGSVTDTHLSVTSLQPRLNEIATPSYTNMFIINNSANEKLSIGNFLEAGAAGAGNAPQRKEFVHKWANTSAQITSIQVVQRTGTPNMGTGTILKVWGSD
jgi:hypothetical protein